MLYKENRKDLNPCSALIRLTSLALSQTDPDRIISQILKDIGKIFNAKLCWIFLVEDNKIKLQSSGDTRSRQNLLKYQLPPKLSPKILKRTYPIISNRIGELYKKNRVMHRFLYERNINKFMGVLLKTNGKLIGALNVARDSESSNFTREDLKSLALLGTVIEMATRKQAEEKILQSEKFLEAIIDNIPNPVFIKDRKHRWVVLNQAVSDLVGHPREKMLGRSDYDFFPKGQADFFWKKDEQMFRTGKVIDIPEEPITDKESNVHYIHTKKAPLRDSSGRITHLVGIIEDITEHKRAESALRKSEENYRLLVENLKDGIYSTYQGVFTSVNESMSKMFGYSKKELLGMPSWNLAAPEIRNSVKDFFFEKVAKKDYSPVEVKCVRKDGSVFIAEVRLSSISEKQQFLGIVSDITERKQAEKALKLFSHSVDSSVDGIAMGNLKDRITYVNETFAKMFGYSRKEIIGKKIASIYAPDQMPKLKKSLKVTMEDSWRGELMGKKKNGKLFPVAISASRVLDDEGKVIAHMASHTDITERKRAEEGLQISQERYKLSTKAANAGVWDWDIKTNKFYIDPNIKEILGYRDDEIPNDIEVWLTYVHPEDREPVMAAAQACLDGKTPEYVFEHRMMHKDGSVHWMLTRGNVIRDAKGNTVRMLGTDTDITERKRTEEALWKSENKYRTLLENLPQKIFFKDKNSVYISCNENYARDLNIKPGEIAGKTDYDFFPKKLAEKYEADDKRIMKSGKIEDIEETYIQDGQKVFVHTVKTPIKGKSGNIVGVLGIFWDITERKRAEEELIRLSNAVKMSTDSIVISDLEGKIIDVNEATLKMYGTEDKENLIGKDSIGLIAPEDRKKALEGMEEALKEGYSKSREYHVITKNGSRIPVEINSAVMKDREGKSIGLVGITRDITERKQVEKALIRNEQIARERARLLTDLRNLDQIDDILTRVCQAVRDSGLFERAVMTLHNPKGRILHLGQVGLPPDMVKRARQTPPIDRKIRDRITSKKFRISDSFFIPAEAGVDFSKTSRYVPQKKGNFVGGDWQPNDELFVPLRDFSGKIMGYLSVDTPTDGCRPDIKTIEALEMLVEAGAAHVREVEAHEALKREHDFSQSIIGAANSMIVCLDADAKITVFNQECERVTGYRREEVLGRRWPELFLPPDHRHFKLKSFAEWVRAHPRDRYEGPILTKSGEIRTILWSNTAILGFGEKEIVAIAIGHDITERKQAEEALRESEEKYRKLVNTSVDGVISVDPQMKIILWNPGAEKMFGYTEEEMLGQSLIKIVPERYRKAKEKGFVEFKKIGSGSVIGKTLEFEGLRKDGTEIPIELSVSTRRVGETYIATSIVRDITKRKQAEEALGRSEKKYRTLVETAQEGIGITDPEENLIFVNQAFADLLGYKKEELLDKNLKTISDQTQYDVFKKETEKRKKGAFSKYEAKLLAKDGKPKYVYVSSAPLWNEDGSFMGTLGVIADLTDIKKAREYNILFNTSRALSKTLKFDQVLKTGAEKMIEVLNADRCAVLLTEDDAFDSKIRVQVYPLKKENVSTPVLNLRTTKDHFSSYKRSLQKQKYIRVFGAGFDSLPELGRKILRKAGISSSLIIPIFLGKKMLGVFHVGMTKKNRTFTEEETRLILTMANQLAVALQNCKLMEDLKKEHKLITEQAEMLKKQTLEKDILLKISRALSKTMDLGEVGKIASQVVGSTLGVDRCAVTLFTQDDNQLEIKGIYSKDQTDLGKLIGTKFSWDDIPAMSDMVKKGKFFAINDISDLPPRSKTKEYFLKAGINSVFGAGMFFGKKLIGILSISSSKAQEGLSQEEVKLIQTIANQIAVAIENARLLQVVKKHTGDLKELSSQLMKVQEKERKRIAQELHGEVGQMLQSMKMNLDRIKRNLSSKPQKLEGTENWLLDTEKLLGQTIDDIRTLTFELRPSMLDDFGLIPTLRWYLENYGKRSNIRVSLKTKNPKYRFPPDIEVTLYRIIQESLTNVAKHAHATEVTVLVSKKDSSAILSVKDNGVGFDANRISLPWKGMGLLNIRERVNLLGGSFEIISRPGKGTRININIPFRR